MKSFHEPFSSLNARHLTCLLRQEFDTFYAVVLLTSKFSQLHYRPQIPLREGNVFIGVCLFTGSGVTSNALWSHGRVLPCIRPRTPLHIRHGEHTPLPHLLFGGGCVHWRPVQTCSFGEPPGSNLW